ncbi:hypothetical protein SLINC_0982 [Streptomyces lincolnensis]|uniref:Uncharacterized protein n=1 Tax=Streptomyces lincolnensis TaxID=1915 RepID=A0A1B1M3I5_STRLN|nr:hypothetical protein [Streptomyces lincolnensis]ANS63206.1 hypothetical protein SLINC_0982 [Streptomyces lincolnensis]AXG52129.1 hypothetical protein SLCG_0974 [Streptomyces lincolnensis]QMV05107.1 hypothetical protein GJU35_05200 [Streptomyces lincolnensis]
MRSVSSREPGEVFGPRMTLFADMLSVGLATAVVCLPVVTIPAALSTACAVLRGAGEGQPATAGRYFAVLRRRLRPGDLAAGAVALAGALLFVADLALARAGLPGAPLFAVVAAAIGMAALVVGLRACARPESLTDWPAAVRGAALDAVRDVGGSALVLLAVATAVLCAWMMVPLAFLAPGPLALALTAVHVRRTVMSQS